MVCHCCCCRHFHTAPHCARACGCDLDFQSRLRRRRSAPRRARSELAGSHGRHRALPASPIESIAGWVCLLIPPMAAIGDAPKSSHADRSPYTPAELRRLFSSPDYLDWVDGRPHRFWGPILGLCMGLRATEVARLGVDDLVLAYGHWCLPIRSPRQKGGGRRETRLVPIPPVVMAAGFLTFVRHARASGAEHLFPALMAPREGCDDPSLGGQRLAGQFALYTMLFEFTPRRVFKALRTTLAVQLAEQGLDVGSIEQLMGRTAKACGQSEGPLTRALLADRAAHALAAVKWPMGLPSYDQHFPRAPRG